MCEPRARRRVRLRLRRRPRDPEPGEEPVVEQRYAEHQREKVEEPVVPGCRDAELEQRDRRDGGEPEPAEARGQEEEPRHDRLDHERDQREAGVSPVRQLVRVPRGPGRQRLGLEVVVERGEVTPGGIAAQQLRGPGEEHQLEQEEDEQVPGELRRRPLLAAQEASRRRPQHGEQAGLEEQHVPLEGEEVLPHDAEREIEQPRAGTA